MGVLAPYFEKYSADGGADPRSTPRGGGARNRARGAAPATPAMKLGNRLSSLWGSLTSGISATLDAAAGALSPRSSLSPRSIPSSSYASPLDAATVLARARAAQGRHTPLGDTPLRV